MSEGQKKPSASKKEQDAVLETGSGLSKKKVVARTSVSTTEKTAKKATTSKKSAAAGAATPPPSSEKKAASKPGRLLCILMLLLATVAVGISVYGYWLLQHQVLENRQLATAQQAFQQRMDMLEQRSAATQTSLLAERRSREQMTAELSALNTALEGIATRLGRTSVGWRLAEVEYLLAIAHHRLSLNRDRDTVLRILLTADEKIRALGEPGLLAVRQAIADEVSALRALPAADTTGMALNLGSLIKNITRLPLIDKERMATAIGTEETAAAVSWRELPLFIWNDIKSLVQVRRHQQATEPLLPPQEAWFLYQNLRLKLEQARLAVLQGDSKLLQTYLAEADNWLLEFFDVDSAAIKSSRESIAVMQQVDLTPPLPDISHSRRLLHNYLLQQASQGSPTMAPPVKADSTL